MTALHKNRSKEHKEHNFLFAQHDPAHCLAPGLFRSLSAKSRSSQKLHVVYNFNQSTQLTFRGDEQLGADDMRVLQGLVASGTLSAKRPVNSFDVLALETKKKLLERLKIQAYSNSLEVHFLTVSIPTLARELGYSSPNGGSTYNKIKESIARLSSVQIHHLHHTDTEWTEQCYQLLAHAEEEGAGSRTLRVALNPRLTAAIRSTEGKQYFRIDMGEARTLQSDAARLLHQRLHWMNAGTTKKIGLETLASYVWPETTENNNTRKTRIRSLKKTLCEFASIGWVVSSIGAVGVSINRPQPRQSTKRKPKEKTNIKTSFGNPPHTSFDNPNGVI